MTWVQLTFILLTTIALSVGQVLFKMSAGTLQLSADRLLENLTNVSLLIALVVYAFATVMWLLVLRMTPLRIAYPFAALAFFFVPVLAHYLLGEDIRWNTFAGAGLIALGVWVSTVR